MIVLLFCCPATYAENKPNTEIGKFLDRPNTVISAKASIISDFKDLREDTLTIATIVAKDLKKGDSSCGLQISFIKDDFENVDSSFIDQNEIDELIKSIDILWNIEDPVKEKQISMSGTVTSGNFTIILFTDSSSSLIMVGTGSALDEIGDWKGLKKKEILSKVGLFKLPTLKNIKMAIIEAQKSLPKP